MRIRGRGDGGEQLRLPRQAEAVERTHKAPDVSTKVDQLGQESASALNKGQGDLQGSRHSTSLLISTTASASVITSK